MGSQKSKQPAAALLTNIPVDGPVQRYAEDKWQEDPPVYVNPLGRTVVVNITSAMESFKIELPIKPHESVKHLCRRVADVKDASWAKLMIGSKMLHDDIMLYDIPENQMVTAIMMNSWERPDQLSSSIRGQISASLEMNGASCPDEAFQQPTWDAFRNVCEPIQNFTVAAFPFKGKQVIRYEFNIGGNGHGSMHVAGTTCAIMQYINGTWKPLKALMDADFPENDMAIDFLVEEQSGSSPEIPSWMSGSAAGEAQQTGSSPFVDALIQADSSRRKLAGSSSHAV